MFGKVGIEKLSSMVVLDSDIAKSKNISLGYPHLNKEKGLFTAIDETYEYGLISVHISDLNRLYLITNEKDLKN